MAHYGKFFTHDKEENYSNFWDSLKLPSEASEYVTRMSAKRRYKIEKNGDTYIYTVQAADKSSDAQSFNFKSGETIERKFNDRPIKITFKVDGDTIYIYETLGNGDGEKTITIKREFPGDSMKETYTSSEGGVTDYRYYKLD